MKNSISLYRIKACLQELWQSHKTLLIYLPVAVLLVLMYAYCLEGPFYDYYVSRKMSSYDEFINRLTYFGYNEKYFSLLLVHVIVGWTLFRYIRRQTTSIKAILNPISPLEKTIGLWIFYAGMCLFGLLVYQLFHFAFVEGFRAIYFADALALTEHNGDLYHDFGRIGIFAGNRSELYVVFFVGLILIPALAFLSVVLFKRLSTLITSGLYILIIFLTNRLYTFSEVQGFNEVTAVHSIPLLVLYSLLCLLFVLLLLAAFIYKLKEKEV